MAKDRSQLMFSLLFWIILLGTVINLVLGYQKSEGIFLYPWGKEDPKPPDIDLEFPKTGILFGTVTIDWDAEDPNDDVLVYNVSYSSDGGNTWLVLATELSSTELDWDTTTIPDGSNYMIEVSASDRKFTDYERSGRLAIQNETPIVELLEVSIDSWSATLKTNRTAIKIKLMTELVKDDIRSQISPDDILSSVRVLVDGQDYGFAEDDEVSAVYRIDLPLNLEGGKKNGTIIAQDIWGLEHSVSTQFVLFSNLEVSIDSWSAEPKGERIKTKITIATTFVEDVDTKAGISPDDVLSSVRILVDGQDYGFAEYDDDDDIYRINLPPKLKSGEKNGTIIAQDIWGHIHSASTLFTLLPYLEVSLVSWHTDSAGRTKIKLATALEDAGERTEISPNNILLSVKVLVGDEQYGFARYDEDEDVYRAYLPNLKSGQKTGTIIAQDIWDRDEDASTRFLIIRRRTWLVFILTPLIVTFYYAQKYERSHIKQKSESSLLDR